MASPESQLLLLASLNPTHQRFAIVLPQLGENAFFDLSGDVAAAIAQEPGRSRTRTIIGKLPGRPQTVRAAGRSIPSSGAGIASPAAACFAW
jgi:hypothetical protein